jgi:hypothetical protein
VVPLALRDGFSAPAKAFGTARSIHDHHGEPVASRAAGNRRMSRWSTARWREDSLIGASIWAGKALLSHVEWNAHVSDLLFPGQGWGWVGSSGATSLRGDSETTTRSGLRPDSSCTYTKSPSLRTVVFRDRDAGGVGGRSVGAAAVTGRRRPFGGMGGTPLCVAALGGPAASGDVFAASGVMKRGVRRRRGVPGESRRLTSHSISSSRDLLIGEAN